MRGLLCFIAVILMAGSLYAQVKVLRIGQKAPEISLPTPDGDTAMLSSLKGKLVLIDFWATWCTPCIKEQPELRVLYDSVTVDSNGSRIGIIDVSLDKSHDNWIKAIERFDIDWIQVSELLL